METKKSYITRTAIILGILVAINILSGFLWFRLDFTADKRYTLSRATLNILNELDEPVTVTAYFSKNLPPNIAETRTDFNDLLIEYANRSKGMVVFEFINPNENDETERQAQGAGVQPVMVNIRERDEIKQQRAYLGAVIQKGEQKDIIPFLQPGAAMEYALSSSIKKISLTEKPQVGLIQGHGEPALGALRQVATVLGVLYNVVPVNPMSDEISPVSHKSLIWLAPEDSINPMVFAKVDEYLSAGGRLFVGINTVKGDFQTSMGSPVSTGLEGWLASKGIEVDDKFLVDARCGSVTVMQQQGFFNIQTPVQFPFLPMITNFADHPITKGIERVVFPFLSSVVYTGDTTGIKATILGKSSGKTGTMPGSTFFNVSQRWTDQNFPLNSLPVGLALEGSLSGSGFSKMVVWGDGDFAVSGEGRNAQQLQQDNVSLLVNSIDWLSDDTGLNELRTKGITVRPIKKELEDGTKTMIKYGNFLSPLFLIIFYGLVRIQLRNRKRKQWMEENYG